MSRDGPLMSWSHCPVCGAQERSPHVEFDALAFVRCAHCSTVYKSRERQGVRAADFYEQEYHTGRSSKRHRRFEHRVRKAGNQIAAGLALTAAGRLLDIGCSLGYTLEAGRRLGLTAAGLDVSKFAVERCRQLGFEAEQGSLEQLPWDDENFDIVVMKHVLEHTPQPKQALREVARVLRPGGAVVITVPNLGYWKSLAFKRSYRYFRPDDLGRQHYVYYTKRTLAALLTAVGFSVAKTGKVIYRRRFPGRSGTGRMLEPVRFAGLLLWQSSATVLLQRREVQMVASKPRRAGPAASSPD